MVFQFVSVYSKLLHYGGPLPTCAALGYNTQVATIEERRDPAAQVGRLKNFQEVDFL